MYESGARLKVEVDEGLYVSQEPADAGWGVGRQE